MRHVSFKIKALKLFIQLRFTVWRSLVVMLISGPDPLIYRQGSLIYGPDPFGYGPDPLIYGPDPLRGSAE